MQYVTLTEICSPFSYNSRNMYHGEGALRRDDSVSEHVHIVQAAPMTPHSSSSYRISAKSPKHTEDLTWYVRARFSSE